MPESSGKRRRKRRQHVSAAVIALLLLGAAFEFLHVYYVSQDYLSLMRGFFMSDDLEIRKDVEPVSVYLVPLHTSRHTRGEHSHFIVDGIQKSPYLNLTFNRKERDVVWIVDMIRAEPEGGCNFNTLLRVGNATEERSKLYGENASTFPVFVMDWSDGAYLWKCDGIEERVGRHNVIQAKRSIVQNRRVEVKDGSPLIHLGSILNYTADWPGYNKYSKWPVRHMPYGVRTDIVEEIARHLKLRHGIEGYPNATWNLASLPRSMDVAHFWPLEKENAPVVDIGSTLRFNVSRAIERLKKEGVAAFVGLSGNSMEEGRTYLQRPYVHAMLTFKIVVVSQRDYHEDHYRLMEALASGALVMMDPMLSLPKILKDGESVVFYHDLEDLRKKVLHYLKNDTARIQVASKGWEEAMSRHRSWHLVEELIFGEIRSKGLMQP